MLTRFKTRALWSWHCTHASACTTAAPSLCSPETARDSCHGTFAAPSLFSNYIYLSTTRKPWIYPIYRLWSLHSRLPFLALGITLHAFFFFLYIFHPTLGEFSSAMLRSHSISQLAGSTPPRRYNNLLFLLSSQCILLYELSGIR